MDDQNSFEQCEQKLQEVTDQLATNRSAQNQLHLDISELENRRVNLVSKASLLENKQKSLIDAMRCLVAKERNYLHNSNAVDHRDSVSNPPQQTETTQSIRPETNDASGEQIPIALNDTSSLSPPTFNSDRPTTSFSFNQSDSEPLLPEVVNDDLEERSKARSVQRRRIEPELLETNMHDKLRLLPVPESCFEVVSRLLGSFPGKQKLNSYVDHPISKEKFLQILAVGDDVRRDEEDRAVYTNRVVMLTISQSILAKNNDIRVNRIELLCDPDVQDHLFGTAPGNSPGQQSRLTLLNFELQSTFRTLHTLFNVAEEEMNSKKLKKITQLRSSKSNIKQLGFVLGILEYKFQTGNFIDYLIGDSFYNPILEAGMRMIRLLYR